MSSIIEHRSDIPDAPLYVLANDSFMSGWGHAEGKTNTVVLPCADADEAGRVTAIVADRPEMRQVRTAKNKPRLRSDVVYSLLTPENAPAWYGRRS